MFHRHFLFSYCNDIVLIKWLNSAYKSLLYPAGLLLPLDKELLFAFDGLIISEVCVVVYSYAGNLHTMYHVRLPN